MYLPYATILKAFLTPERCNTSLACWFWSLAAVHLSWQTALTGERTRESRTGSNFLSRSHCWNLFTAQSVFVVTGCLQNLPPRADFYYSSQNGRKHILFFLLQEEYVYPFPTVLHDTVYVKRWSEEYFGIVFINHREYYPLLSLAKDVPSHTHGKSVCSCFQCALSLYPLMGGLLSKSEKLKGVL